MSKTINKVQVIGLSADYLRKNKGDAADLMRKHGVKINRNASQKEVDAAFASLLPRSTHFRKEFAGVLAKELSGYSNASGDARTAYAEKFNKLKIAAERSKNGAYCPTLCDINKNKMFSADGAEMLNYVDDGFFNYVDDKFFNGAGVEGSDTTASKTKGQWLKNVGSYLGNVFTPEQVQKTLNTGLDVWASSKMGGSKGIQSIDNELNAGRNANTGVAGGSNQGKTATISTTTWVILGIAGAAILGTIAYVVYKKK